MSEFTKANLVTIMPTCAGRIDPWIGFLNAAAEEFEFDFPLRRAAFIAQAAHECAEFKFMKELASGEAYEGRKDLGNTQLGDGARFKGRGIFQLTGHANYDQVGYDLFLDRDWFSMNPALAELPEYACRIAGWFWKKNGLSQLADDQDFRGITKRINGGYNGWSDRLAYYERAKAVLL